MLKTPLGGRTQSRVEKRLKKNKKLEKEVSTIKIVAESFILI
jgi:hypothetical protein